MSELAGKKSLPLTVPIIFVSLVLIGNLGLSYIVSVLTGAAELQILTLLASLLIFGGSALLSLRMLYHIDRRSSRIKKRVSLFEPVKEDKEDE